MLSLYFAAKEALDCGDIDITTNFSFSPSPAWKKSLSYQKHS